MSSERDSNRDQSNWTRDSNSDPDTTSNVDWWDIKVAVHERDRYTCVNCGVTKNRPDDLHVDHSIPRGRGGSNRFSNLQTLCKGCHRAKHEETTAPTVRLETTGDMSAVEFAWFKHFIKHQVPALSRQVVEPGANTYYKLDDKKVWHISLGDVRRLDKQLSEVDSRYQSLRADEYM